MEKIAIIWNRHAFNFDGEAFTWGECVCATAAAFAAGLLLGLAGGLESMFNL